MKVTLPTSFPRCKICKKPLKNSRSIANGVGPECATKFAAMLVASGLTLESLEIPVQLSTDRLVARNLHVAEQALLAGRMSDVERFKVAAREAARRAAAAIPPTIPPTGETKICLDLLNGTIGVEEERLKRAPREARSLAGGGLLGGHRCHTS